MSILDLEPSSREIDEACSNRYGDRYTKLAWRRMLYDVVDPALTDLEHAMEMELIQKKRLHAESKDAIVSV